LIHIETTVTSKNAFEARYLGVVKDFVGGDKKIKVSPCIIEVAKHQLSKELTYD